MEISNGNYWIYGILIYEISRPYGAYYVLSLYLRTFYITRAAIGDSRNVDYFGKRTRQIIVLYVSQYLFIFKNTRFRLDFK